ncbi:MAG: Purine-binding protein [Firmicutes bacterium]|nr:Purine-binding protein [Bacillota bacterium]
MKKGLLIAVVLVMVSTLVLGCPRPIAKEPPPIAEEPVKPIRVGVIYSVPVHAGAYDQAQWAAQNRVLVEEFGWHLSLAEDVPFPKLAAAARGFAVAGYDIVIFTSAGHTAAWHEVAPEFPDTWFVLISLVAELPDSPRVAGWDLDMYHGGTIVGVAMAKLSEAGHFGIVAGVPVPAFKVLFSGIFAGAQFVNPDIRARVAWVGGWADVPKAHELARVLIGEGADVLYDISGWGYRGTIAAAEDAGIRFVGYALDQYFESPVVVTSHVWDLDRVYYDLATMLEAGTLERKIYPIGPGYTTLAPFRGRIPAELEAEIMELVRKIDAGEIVIPVVMRTIEGLTKGMP